MVLNKQQKPGFTLIELLISISIIATLSSMFLLLSYQQGKKLALQRSAFQLVSDLRLQEEKAMNGVAMPCPGGGVSYSLGMHLEKNDNFYTLFVDCDKNKARKEDKGEDIKTVYLEKNIILDTVYPSSSFLNVVFEPPEPTVYLNNKTDGQEAVVLLKDTTNPSNSKNVKINSAGRIEMQ